MKRMIFLSLAFLAISGCATVPVGSEADPGQGIAERKMDFELQMAHNPVSCLLIKMIDSVVGNDLNGYRALYRWAGFEAGDDFIRFRSMMLTATMPFTMRMDPPLYELTGRGEADLARIKAQLSCGKSNDPIPDGFAVREVRVISFESIKYKCRIELFHGTDSYSISKVVWDLAAR